MAGLYIHFPFCIKKCNYCDFYSVSEGLYSRAGFLKALEKEIQLFKAHWILHEPIQTIYLGGGTPSLLSVQELSVLFQNIFSVFSVDKNSEITMEANPGTLSVEKIRGYHEVGVNRFSIGAQSFDHGILKKLGRIYKVDKILETIQQLKQAGIENIGIDLIYGIPDQSFQQWSNTLQKTIQLAPAHISAYSLTWSLSTEIGRQIESGKLTRPDDQKVSDMFLMAHEQFSEAGYEHYEISNYSKPGFRCLHNEGYWTGKAYLGFGPSAHSYLNGRRFWNISNISQYIDVLSQNQLPIAGQEILNSSQMTMEHLALGLRRKEGIDTSFLQGQEGLINHLKREGLAKLEQGNLALTAKGFLLADEVAVQFVQ